MTDVDWTSMAGTVSDPARDAEDAELSQCLRDALALLPPRQAEVFCLRHLNELSYREIARQLDLKTSAVGVLLHRGRKRLRQLLSPADANKDAEVPR
jgi:RNA polymerase sigma-70 factor (ECF subfamily)